MGKFSQSVDADVQYIVEGDTVIFDRAEGLLINAAAHMLRAGLLIATAYNVDLYKDASNRNYTWIDDLIDADTIKSDIEYITVSGDTLYKLWMWNDTAETRIIFNMLKYNYHRPDFLTLKKSNHAKALTDLQAVPALLKAALSAIRSESPATQEYDLIKIGDIISLEEELLYTYNDLIAEGFTPEFAGHFYTPEILIKFIEDIVTGSYTITRLLDSSDVSITVNLPAFFNNPVQDLRNILPYFAWSDEAQWIKKEEWDNWSDTVYNNMNGKTTFWVHLCDDYQSLIIDIPPALIDSIAYNSYDSCRAEYILDTALTWRVYIDSSTFIQPIIFTDAAGNELDMNDSAFFPVFRDPTIGGVFPGMTNADWEALFEPLINGSSSSSGSYPASPVVTN
jgi:hypothetical protein